MKRIFVAGHNGMVGKAICRKLILNTDVQLITCDRSELDLLDQKAVQNFFENEPIDEVILCAAKVGGIHANNTYPANFIYENLQIQNNVIHSSHVFGIQKLLFLGSSCIYPKFSEQPIKEEALLSGYLEPTNEAYAIAKIAGIKMCESYNRQYGRDYRSVMPTNLYGPGDNYDLNNSHVVPALIRKFHDAKTKGSGSILVWGSGKPMREFMYVDDMAEASLYVHNLPNKTTSGEQVSLKSHINVGTGRDISILQLAELIASVVGYDGAIDLDESMPDGTPKKLLDVTRLQKFGWSSKISLKKGLALTYADFLLNYNEQRL